MSKKILFDTNLIIYAAHPNHPELRAFIEQTTPSVSIVSKIEALGYFKLEEDEKVILTDFFNIATVLPISNKIVNNAIKLRQQKSMTLGDSLIGATALTHDLKLATHNTDDFSWIKNLDLIDPLSH